MTQADRQLMRRDIGELAAFFQRHDGEFPQDISTTLKALMIIGLVLIEHPQQEVVDDIMQRCDALVARLKG